LPADWPGTQSDRGCRQLIDKGRRGVKFKSMNDLSSSTPFFYLTIGQAETLVKSWIAETLKAVEPLPDPAPVFYNRLEVCKLLKISLPTLYKYTTKGIINGKKFGSRILFSKEDCEKAIKEIPVKKYSRS